LEKDKKKSILEKRIDRGINHHERAVTSTVSGGTKSVPIGYVVKYSSTLGIRRGTRGSSPVGLVPRTQAVIVLDVEHQWHATMQENLQKDIRQVHRLCTAQTARCVAAPIVMLVLPLVIACL
jgi:hypothetical protein